MGLAATTISQSGGAFYCGWYDDNTIFQFDADTVFTQVSIWNAAGTLIDAPSGSPNNITVGAGSIGQGNYTAASSLPFDSTLHWRADLGSLNFPNAHGSIQYFKSNAAVATAGTPSSSSVDKFTATIACNFNAQVVESTATVWLEYKKQTDSTWTQAGLADSITDSTNRSISRNLSGLSASTVYNFRLQISRTTNNSTTLTTSTVSFTTLPDAPNAETLAATSVTYNSATLQGTVSPNGFTCRVRLEWGLTSGAEDHIGDWYTPPVDSSPHAFSQATGAYLAYSTTYYFRYRLQYPADFSNEVVG